MRKPIESPTVRAPFESYLNWKALKFYVGVVESDIASTIIGRNLVFGKRRDVNYIQNGDFAAFCCINSILKIH